MSSKNPIDGKCALGDIDVEAIVRDVAHSTIAALVARNFDRYLTEHEVATRFGLEPKALQNWRQKGGGPPYRKFGSAVRYALSDLIAFEDAALRKNTSQRPEQ
ncbi:helix-turn-helix transcriptional regulator [Rhodospira trueperi]|uniref:Helix-turn-helix domain-containing protein n=1 Tax=Rhodospira trueperi TaxID=69960 RepID=A0A1G7ELU0_9PROT|nr:helix-turn-helix domain-containing protein [Rhodospira trueperi]SDE64614.1 Helix-turn-helix domain-containing protein [Rhodospira trueperi]